MAARRPEILGKTQPRLWTRPQRPLNRRTSHGYAVCDFAETIGEPLLPWQRWLAIHAMELRPDGSYRFRVILVLVARQNGKSTFKRTVSLWRLYVTGARLVLGVAQDAGLAREQQNYCLDTIYGCPHLAEDLGQVRRVNGDEWFKVAGDIEYEDGDGDESFTLAGGGRYKIAASNRKAGRGLSVDELDIDELREWHTFEPWSALYYTTMARADAQIWCMSNAGDDRSVVLNQLHGAALSGRDPSIGLFEWSGAENCELDDWKQLAQANPGLGYTVGAAAISTAISTDPPNVFRTEVLCQKVDQLDGAVDYQAWKACADPQGRMDAVRGQVTLCFDSALDGQHCTLAAAAELADGRPRVEIVAAWGSTDEARRDLSALIAKIKPAAFAWFPAGPAAELATILHPAALKANQRPGKRDPAWKLPENGALTGLTVAEACQELAGLTRDRRILHAGQELLDDHIRGASKLYTGDGWRFTRRGAGHVDAAYAAAGAVHAALTMPKRKRARIRIVG